MGEVYAALRSRAGSQDRDQGHARPTPARRRRARRGCCARRRRSPGCRTRTWSPSTTSAPPADACSSRWSSIEGDTLARAGCDRSAALARRDPATCSCRRARAGRGARAPDLIHRDFKPQNVMVGGDGARARDGLRPRARCAPDACTRPETQPAHSRRIADRSSGTPRTCRPSSRGERRRRAQPISSASASRCTRRCTASARSPATTSRELRTRGAGRRSRARTASSRRPRAGCARSCCAACAVDPGQRFPDMDALLEALDAGHREAHRAAAHVGRGRGCGRAHVRARVRRRMATAWRRGRSKCANLPDEHAAAWPTAADAPRRAADSRPPSSRPASPTRASVSNARASRSTPTPTPGQGCTGRPARRPRPAPAMRRRRCALRTGCLDQRARELGALRRRVLARGRQGRAQGRRRDAGAAAARQLRGCARAEERRASRRTRRCAPRAITARAAGDVVGDGGGGARLAGPQTDGGAGRRGAGHRPRAAARRGAAHLCARAIAVRPGRRRTALRGGVQARRGDPQRRAGGGGGHSARRHRGRHPAPFRRRRALGAHRGRDRRTRRPAACPRLVSAQPRHAVRRPGKMATRRGGLHGRGGDQTAGARRGASRSRSVDDQRGTRRPRARGRAPRARDGEPRGDHRWRRSCRRNHTRSAPRVWCGGRPCSPSAAAPKRAPTWTPCSTRSSACSAGITRSSPIR